MICMPGNCKQLLLTPMILMTEPKMSENTTVVSNENVKISITEATEAHDKCEKVNCSTMLSLHVMLLFFNF